jgi:hypothetical protein
MASLSGRRAMAGTLAIAAGISLGILVNPSLAVGSNSPPQPCSGSGSVQQESPPVDCPKLTVQPSANLVDLQLVSLHGSDYTPLASLATIECAAGATGEDQCDLSTLIIVPASSTGTFSLKRYVRRVISPFSGTVDCGITPGACIMAGVNIGDFLEAAAVPLSFNPSVPPVVPAVFVTPSLGLVDHQVVSAVGAGFFPNSGVEILQCAVGTPSPITCDFSTSTFVPTGPRGGFSIRWPVHRILYLPTGTLDCARRVATCQVFAGNYPGSPMFATAPLAFKPSVPPVTQTLVASATRALRDHQLVTLKGTGFTPGASVELIQCQAPTAAGGGCDYSTLTNVTADFTGNFLVTYPLHRLISFGPIGPGPGPVPPGLPTPFDCASAPRACVVSATNQQRFEESANVSLSFDPQVPPVKAAITVVPSTKLADNQTVTVAGTGFTPFATVSIEQCGAKAVTQHNFGYCNGGYYGGGGQVLAQASGTGTFSITFFVHRAIAGEFGLINCAAAPGACVIAGTRFTLAGDTAFKAIAFK